MAHVRAWVMLYRNVSDEPNPTQQARWRSLDAPVCHWTRNDVFAAFPRLPSSIRESEALETSRRDGTPQYIQDYFWFHCSLVVWLRWHQHAYPTLRHIWRFEPDVLVAGSLRQLFYWSSAHVADLVVPRIGVEAERGWVGFFQRDPRLFDGIPHHRRVWSLVCVGRYSLRFLRHMEAKWLAGHIGYEEIFLPTSCLNATDFECKLDSLGEGVRANGFLPYGGRADERPGADSLVLRASHVRFRPFWSCEEFLAARHRRLGDLRHLALWHPVKERDCYADYLDGKNGSAVAASLALSAPPPSPPPPPYPPRPPPEDERKVVNRMAFQFTDRPRHGHGQ